MTLNELKTELEEAKMNVDDTKHYRALHLSLQAIRELENRLEKEQINNIDISA
ncbi:hypothetical protein [Tepidibacter hydrothermalis]|uniref:Uncharacterized protein n=1 Tax=Tepidibacter hydrothermalis TaxID=3036126 RepID=A0ABY8EB51_9FIRM|nr:hypothetical protein [Tepidibacter hydrothermalis]WFD08742.1 hypothetical protein P4S50_10065 [Tepidibacter hydrothermalis]